MDVTNHVWIRDENSSYMKGKVRKTILIRINHYFCNVISY